MFVIKWSIHETQISPYHKYVVMNRAGLKTWESHATHLLQESQLIYQNICASLGSLKVNLYIHFGGIGYELVRLHPD